MPNLSEIRKKVIEISAEVLRIEVDKINFDSSFKDLGVDVESNGNISIITIAIQAGEVFGVDIPIGEVDSCETIENIVQYIIALI